MSNKKGSPKDWTFFYYVRNKFKGLLNIKVCAQNRKYFFINSKEKKGEQLNKFVVFEPKGFQVNKISSLFKCKADFFDRKQKILI